MFYARKFDPTACINLSMVLYCINGDTTDQSWQIICVAFNWGNNRWTAAAYPFFYGLTLAEGYRYRLGTFKPEGSVARMHEIRIDRNAVLPDRFDARNRWPGLVHPVRDQGNCAASWAFSTAGELIIINFTCHSSLLVEQQVVWIFMRRYPHRVFPKITARIAIKIGAEMWRVNLVEKLSKTESHCGEPRSTLNLDLQIALRFLIEMSRKIHGQSDKTAGIVFVWNQKIKSSLG